METVGILVLPKATPSPASDAALAGELLAVIDSAIIKGATLIVSVRQMAGSKVWPVLSF